MGEDISGKSSNVSKELSQASKAAKVKAKVNAEPHEVPSWFPDVGKQLVASYRNLDKLLCLLHRRNIPATFESLGKFAGVYPGRAVTEHIMLLCPTALSMKGNEITMKPTGVAKAKESKRLKAVITSLSDHCRTFAFGHWAGVEKDETPQQEEKRLKKTWKELQSTGIWAEELHAIASIMLPKHTVSSPAPASSSTASKASSTPSPMRPKAKTPKLVRGDDGGTSCISLTDRDYSAYSSTLGPMGDGLDREGAMLGGFEDTEAESTAAGRKSNAEVILGSITELSWYRDQLIYQTKYEGKQARFLSLSGDIPLPPLLIKAVHVNMGVDISNGLYRHQALAIDALRQGKHLTLSTETSSGKSLVYNLPVLEAIMADPSTTALYLFPTKALAQDQLRATNAMCGQDPAHRGQNSPKNVVLPVLSAICDGDSGLQAREAVKMDVTRGGANIILTNPDMLHHTIIPQHMAYKRMFRTLRFVVIDEGHCYRGTFGAHIACVMRRLVRVCLLHKLTPPQFIICSATISNPASLFSALLPIDVLGGLSALAVVDPTDGGTAKGERLFAMWNPSLTEATRQRQDRQHAAAAAVVEPTTGANEGGVQGEPDLAALDVPSELVMPPHNPYATNDQGNKREEGGEQDAALASFLQGCEDRYRLPVSYQGVHGDKPRHQAKYLEAKSKGWKRSREEEELNGGLGEGPLARKMHTDAQAGRGLDAAARTSDGASLLWTTARDDSKPDRSGSDSTFHNADEEKSNDKNRTLIGEMQNSKEKEHKIKHSSPRGTWVSERERESPFVEIARLLAYLVRLRLRVLCFCGTRNLVEMVNRMAKSELVNTYKAPHLRDSIASYRGGYTAKDRREIESKLFSGQLLGVCATCALELGVDVGSLDVTLHLGYPGSISSLWQQAGRAGRGGRPSLSIIVCFDSPVDQYFARFPEKLLRAPVEGVMLGVDNPHILRGHLLCAANEERLNSIKLLAAGLQERLLWGSTFAETAISLIEGGNLVVSGATTMDGSRAADPSTSLVDRELRFAFASAGTAGQVSSYNPSMSLAHSAGGSTGSLSLFERPSRSVNLRLIDPITIDIIDTGGDGTKGDSGRSSSGRAPMIIDSMSYSRAFFEAFPGSVFYHQARQYLITSLDVASRKAYCHSVSLDYSTTALNDTVVTIVHEDTRDLKAIVGNVDDGVAEITGATGTHVSPSAPEQDGRDGFRAVVSFGTVSVVKKVSGFVKRSLRTRELLEEGEFNLPPLEFETQAVWIDLPIFIKKAVEARGFDVGASLHAANHAFCSVAAIEALCDPGDLDCEHFGTMSMLNGLQPKRMLCYDRRPGGLGICETLAAAGSRTLKMAQEVLQSCACSSPLGKGCPSCLLDGRCSHYNENLSKDGAVYLLGMLYTAANSATDPTSHTNSVDNLGQPQDDNNISGAASSPVATDRTSGSKKELTPRELRRMALARQARFRDTQASRGLFVASAWSKDVDESTT